MNIIQTLFGHGKDLDSLQMTCRATLAFFLTLLHESIRRQLHVDGLEQVKEIIQERNGEISIIKKPDPNAPAPQLPVTAFGSE